MRFHTFCFHTPGILLVIALLILTSPGTCAAFFIDIDARVTPLYASSSAWGDYDRDGDLDLAICGIDSSARPTSQLWQNVDGGAFVRVDVPWAAISDGTLAWCDYDGDGDLDIAIGGMDVGGNGVAVIYRNDDDRFFDAGVVLPGLRECSLAWGDYDNDGKPDLIMAGAIWNRTNWVPASYLFRNLGNGQFVQHTAALPGLRRSTVLWADFDNDGDLDIAMSGLGSDELPHTYIVRNNGDTTFTSLSSTGIPALQRGSLACADFDCDGLLDLAVSGLSSSGAAYTGVYRNIGGLAFSQLSVDLPQVSRSSLAWGDCDNDGYPDLAISGYMDSGESFTDVFVNQHGGGFVPLSCEMPQVNGSSLSWGDFDDDGKLDIALSGLYRSSDPITIVYRNVAKVHENTAPSAPSGLSSTMSSGKITFHWNASNDEQTPSQGLSYNLRVWAAGTNDMTSSMAFPKDGRRLIPAIGNSQERLSYTLNGVSSGAYLWKVQAVDAAYAGSIWSATGYAGKCQISGYVRTPGGAPVSGVTLTATGGTSTTTDTSGYYAMQLNAGWSGTVTASMAGYFITPASQSYSIITQDYSNQNYTASVAVKISGYTKTSTGTAIGGVVLTATNGGWSTTSTGAGYYELSVPSGWSGSISPSSPSYAFSPGSRIYSNVTAAISGQDYSGGTPYTISGYVRGVDGAPLSGIMVAATNNGPITTTNSTGFYQLRVQSSWSGYVAPSKPGRSFTPQSRPYSYLSADRPDQNYNITWFTDTGVAIQSRSDRSVAWADYDGDGDYDLVLNGEYSSMGSSFTYTETKLFRNDDGTFVDTNSELAGSSNGELAWGDCDNDGDVDLVVTGSSDTGYSYVSSVYKNNNGALTHAFFLQDPVSNSSVAWGDYNNDGKLDLVLFGTYLRYGMYPTSLARICRNTGDGFGYIEPESFSGNDDAAWGDYDNDGDLDLAIASSWGSLICRNDGNNQFTNIGASLVGGTEITWADFDNDGYLDVLVSGDTLTLYRNNQNGSFVDSGAIPAGIRSRAAVWGDYDNDGDQDLALAIYRPQISGYAAVIYRNDGISFTDIGDVSGLIGSAEDIAWGDYDNDGDLDLVIAQPGTTTKVLRNDGASPNTRPSTPTGLSAAITSTEITFSWNAASDAQTPAGGLTYNLRVGTTPGGQDVFSGMADLSTGLRRLAAFGNAQKRLSWKLKMPARTVYWSVQAIDSAYTGSAWATERIAFVPKVSGRISIPDGTGVSGVYIYDASSQLLATTDSSGYYEFYIPSGSSVVLTPVKHAVEFYPGTLTLANITTDKPNQDFSVGTLTDTGDSLIGGSNAALAWGDYDNDGDLDLLISGDFSTKLYRNDAGSFTDTGIVLMGTIEGSAAWGDYDNDGDLDIAICGRTETEPYYATKIYRNDGNETFTDIAVNLEPVGYGALAWGDFDNDGDLDLAVTGGRYDTTWHLSTKVYRNEGNGVFTDIHANLLGAYEGDIAWGDYDGDGDLDLAVCGYSSSAGAEITKVYRNDAGVFIDSGLTLNGVRGDLAWADYDADGDMDLAVAGTGYGDRIYIYNNIDQTYFDEQSFMLYNSALGDIAWADYDNDGLLELVYVGSGESGILKIQGNVFVKTSAVLPAAIDSVVAVADYDNDGDLDFAVSASSDYGTTFTKIYRNDRPGANTVPSAPTGLASSSVGRRVTFTWNAASDAQTPSAGLQYNIRVGTTPGSGNICTAMANLSTGLRCLPALGNVNGRLSWSLDLPVGTYYWSVQSIDTAFAGSTWASEQSLTVTGVVIDGYVRTIDGYAISNALISTTNGDGSTTTDASGHYSLLVAIGWSGTVTPLKTGYTFSPASKNYTNVISPLTDENYIVAQGFTQLATSIPGVSSGQIAWGDYDGDGDLDLAFAGSGVCGIARNDGDGVFTNTNTGMQGLTDAALAWGDYDNDGDLDLVITGTTYYSNLPTTNLYQNNGDGTFSLLTTTLTAVCRGSIAWGDYDNDGDLDLALAGATSTSFTPNPVAILYRNDGNGNFVDTHTALPNVYWSSLAWVDYDNDGDLDLSIAGITTLVYINTIYRNDGGVFVDAEPSIAGMGFGNLAWGDYDNDGDMDLAAAGSTGAGATNFLYRNDYGLFADVGMLMIGGHQGDVAWGDYDNDGDPDLAITGDDWLGTETTTICRNDGNDVFSDAGIQLPPLMDSSIAWGDYDGDGDLDIALSGSSGVTGTITRIYRNDTSVRNHKPSAPTGLTTVVNGGNITCSWAAATDTQTPSHGLNYNLRVGTAPGRGDIFCATADSSSGLRQVAAVGNVGKRLAWTIKGLQPGTYYWSVQSIDPAFAGSAWSAEQSVVITSVKISGHVRTASGVGIQGVTLTFSNSGGSVVTDSNGFYQQTLPRGWSGTVTPSRDHWTFSPAQKSYSNVNTDIIKQFYTGVGFVDTGAAISAVQNGAIAWGDYNGDGRLDLAVAGLQADYTCISKIYQNNPDGTFSDINAGIVGVSYCSLAWGDYDNDGDLDLAVFGYTQEYTAIGKIYRNDDGSFVDTGASLDAFYDCAAAWADYDNDGDLDLLVAGYSDGAAATKLYRNDEGTLLDSGLTFPGVSHCSLAWGDYDNDGDMDFVLAGINGAAASTRLYKNNGNGTFTLVGSGFMGIYAGSLEWVDYDNDGDLDLSIFGKRDTYSYLGAIYKNNGDGTFTNIKADLVGVEDAALAWGDYDNDGDPDLLVAGYRSLGQTSENRTRLYRNDTGGVFTEIDAGLPAIYSGSLAWGDCDGDGDLDIAMCGVDSPGTCITRVYRNEALTANTAPQAPGSLSSVINGNDVTFIWSAATDAQTPAGGLSYNLRVGTAPGQGDVFCSSAGQSSGLRMIPAAGNAQKQLSWTLKGLNPAAQTYYWSVQAIDPSFIGSVWAVEQAINSDTNPPVIISVGITPPMAAVGDLLTITVDATDDTAVTTVIANGQTLSNTNPGVWTGMFTAASSVGRYPVDVTAIDAAGNQADMTVDYKVAPVVGIGCRSLIDPIMPEAAGLYLFKVWGIVTVIDANYLYVDDGSGVPVKVYTPGHDMENGDYIWARGMLEFNGHEPVIISKTSLMGRLR